MANTLRDVFRKHTSNIKITPNLIKDLRVFESQFVNKNEDHIAYFGGNLLGVHPMRFKVTDYNTWFDEVLVIDDMALQEDIYNLPAVDSSHKVGPNVFNLSCIWLIYAIRTSTSLSEALKKEGEMLATLILQYRYMGSILSHFYPYPVDEALAQATYRSLSRKFGLKVHGSWKKLFVARAQDILSDKSIHNKTLKSFSDDPAVLYVVSDMHTRLKQLVKDMTEVLYQVRDSEMRVSGSGMVAEQDGEKIIKDVINKERDYIRYIHTTIETKSSFIKEDLVETTLELMYTASEKHLMESLHYMTNNYKGRLAKDIQVLTQELIVYSMDYVTRNKDTIPNPKDFRSVVLKLRGVFMASKNTEESIQTIRELAEKIVRLATGTRNPNTLASARTALLIYLLLRTLAKDYYG